MSKASISIILPAYRKSEVIKEVLLNLYDLMQINDVTNFECILVVDGGNDETSTIAEELNLKNLQILKNPINLGKGYCLSRGISCAQGEYVGYIDADLDINADGLILAIDRLKNESNLHAVVGSKWLGGKSHTYPLIRRVGSRLFRILVQVLFKISVADTQTGLKVFRLSEIKEIVSSIPLNQRFLWDLEVLYHYSKRHWDVGEIPVEINYLNQTSIKFRDIVRSFVGIFRLRLKYIWRK